MVKLKRCAYVNPIRSLSSFIITLFLPVRSLRFEPAMVIAIIKVVWIFVRLGMHFPHSDFKMNFQRNKLSVYTMHSSIIRIRNAFYALPIGFCRPDIIHVNKIIFGMSHLHGSGFRDHAKSRCRYFQSIRIMKNVCIAFVINIITIQITYLTNISFT